MSVAFWNDPQRWDGIEDPHKDMFWMHRRRDVIDVRQAENALPDWYYKYVSPQSAYRMTVL